MMKIVGLALCIYLVFSPVRTSTGAPVPDEVQNPSFEEGKKTPAGWRTHTSLKSEAVFVWNKTVARTGQRSLYIRNTGPGSAGWLTVVKVKGDTTYLLTVWAKAKNGKGVTTLRVRGAYKVKGKRKIWEDCNPKGIKGNHDDWTQISFEFKTDPKIQRLGLWLWNLNGDGDEVWFDDVELVEKTAD